jgi:exosortase
VSLRRLINVGWTPWHVASTVAMTLVGLIATWPSWADIFTLAVNDEEASHIFLVPIVAAWMAWVRQARIRYCAPRGQFIGPIIVALGWGLYAYGYDRGVQAAWHFGAVVVVLGCALSVLGKNILIRFLPSFAVLAFLVPIPGSIRQEVSNPLQTATAAGTQALLETFGVPVERSGNVLSINGKDVAVAEACNGLRMVFALFLVSYAFAFSLPLRPSVRVIVLLASPLAAIGCNILRLIPTVWLYGYATDSAADAFHDISGWLMLPVAFLFLLGIVRTLRWALIPVAKFNLAYH